MAPPINLPPGGPVEPVMFCATEIRDQAIPTSCIQASSTPALGLLYPLSSNLFVAVGGNVGIGTTAPSAKLDVAGPARVTDTLTLNPSGDQALHISTGSIYKGGALFMHTKGGSNNAAFGQRALSNVTAGNYNTASGAYALYFNTTGFKNTATGALTLQLNTTGHSNTATGYLALQLNTTGSFNTATGVTALLSNTTGYNNTATGVLSLFLNTTGSNNTASGSYALLSNTTGNSNTASGYRALVANTTGYNNTAIGRSALSANTTASANTATGFNALRYNTTGYNNTATGVAALRFNTTGSNNTASGNAALFLNTTGSRNIGLGFLGGINLTTGNDNIAIGSYGVAGESATIRIGTGGTHTRAFLAGIRGVTTGNADAIPVLVDSAGQLGTVSSSRHFKQDIRDMGELTDRLLELRPVAFRYKQEQKLPSGDDVPLEYGLIAEEVAEIFPDLVVSDGEGKPFTVKYHVLSSMLLNELKKLHARDQERARDLEELRAKLEDLEGRFSKVDSLAAR